MSTTAGAEPIDTAALVEGIVRWVEIESPTSDKAAVNRMIDRVQHDLSGLPIKLERAASQGRFADILTARLAGAADGPGILILSHVDTVHPIGTIRGELPVRRDGDKLYGPGVFDMKGGAYLAMEAFRRVARAGWARLPVTFMFTPDEEFGSPASRAPIEAEARKNRYVLVTEPARDGGKVVTARKGVGRFEITAKGVPAHSGARHRDGRSAIKEMARQVLAIEAMTDYARGITTTVGMIAGGTAPNVIPEHCRITADLRVPDAAAGRELEARILGLKTFDPDVKLTITGGMNRPPYEKTPAVAALLDHARACAQALGFDLADTEMTGGGSDGNFTAALGIATLDGLGIDGDGAHTHWEHALISSIVPRLQLMQRMLETLE
ncbi:MAG TPA: M20 family metallopeptidase [Xanthobacteraceae bacterium]|nr:M20 family metallopeptidase [Xanthobacteraceae bacterium]